LFQIVGANSYSGWRWSSGTRSTCPVRHVKHNAIPLIEKMTSRRARLEVM